jgi:hypothetical protein
VEFQQIDIATEGEDHLCSFILEEGWDLVDVESVDDPDEV